MSSMMLRRLSHLLAAALVVSSTVAVAGVPSLTPQQAPAHVGQVATVCGVVASAKHSARTNGQPTFLNLGQPYPNHVFTIVIWGSDRPKFGMPEVTLAGKSICVRGTVSSYRGNSQIVATDPQQITTRR